MSTAENAKLQYEAGQSSTAMSALTDSGDATTFTSGASLWSRRAGYTPVVLPNGVLTGGAITATAVNNQVSIAAMTLNLNGVVTAVGSGTLLGTRATPSDTHMITSLTVDSSGTLVAVAGADGTAFSETRGANGGPPLIAVDSVEIGQIRFASSSAAVVAASEIYAVPGLHMERADYPPVHTVNYSAGSVTFLTALMKNHTAGVAKKVFASYAAPLFADIALASDFVPPETSHSVTSQQIYGTTLGSTNSTLNQGSFTAYLNDGITDGLVGLKNQRLWFKFFPDRYAASYIPVQGKLGISRTFPAGDSIQAACTISAETAPNEVP